MRNVFGNLLTVLLAVSFSAGFVGCGELEDIQEHPDIPDEMSEGEFDEKVIGGNLVKKPPEHIGVLLFEQSDSQFANFCTASLINNDTLLTAAHCVDGDIAEAVEAGRIYVCLGQKDWKFCRDEDLAQVIRVVRHGDYNPGTLENDIAIAKLGTQFRNRKKAKLPKSNAKIKGKTRSYGYGKKKTPIGHFANSGEGFEQVGGSNGKMDRKLRALNTKVLTNRKCAAAVSALNLPMREPASNEICLKVSAKKNLCEGDSGGPTFIKGKLVGVASRVTFGARVNEDSTRARIRKCDGSGPSIVTSVKDHLGFIRRHAR